MTIKLEMVTFENQASCSKRLFAPKIHSQTEQLQGKLLRRKLVRLSSTQA